MKQIDEWFSTPIGSVSTEKDFKLTNYCKISPDLMDYITRAMQADKGK